MKPVHRFSTTKSFWDKQSKHHIIHKCLIIIWTCSFGGYIDYVLFKVHRLLSLWEWKCMFEWQCDIVFESNDCRSWSILSLKLSFLCKIFDIFLFRKREQWIALNKYYLLWILYILNQLQVYCIPIPYCKPSGVKVDLYTK